MTPARQTSPIRVSYDRAFLECCQIVQRSLNETGLRWTPEAEQAAVCTLIIAADKRGLLTMWEAPPEPEPIRRTPSPVRTMPNRESGDMTGILAASIEHARAKQQQPNGGIPPANLGGGGQRSSPPSSFDVMLQAFDLIAQELPPEVYSAVLEWHGVSSPQQFTRERQAPAIACYVALKQARDEYRAKCADPTTFEHFQAEEPF